ncbi:MAG: hypothetical protein M3N21_00390 [Actinomycetota bacterium]|nr:hypothetical protein [Actinomycetota bacterium]
MPAASPHRPASRRPAVAVAASVVIAGCLGVVAATPSLAAKSSTSGVFAFSHSVQVDPQRLGSEPIIKADPSGGLYASSIIGFSNSVSFLWKSRDHGTQWDLVHALPNLAPAQRPTATHGGGDSEIVIGPKVKGQPGYTVSFYDLESLADIGVATSFDSGRTFSAQSTNALAGDTVGTDRQWGQLWRDPQGRDHLFLVYNATASNNGKGTILRESLDYGKTWKDLGDGGTLNGVFNSGALGQLRVDKAGDLFFTSENSPSVNLVRGLRQPDGTYRFSSTTVSNEAGTNTRQLFITSALDSAGNIYVAWSRSEAHSTDVGTYVAVSTDRGTSFRAPVRVNAPGFRNGNFPWVIAGDPGRVSVVYYGTKTKGDSTHNFGPWYVMSTQSVDFLSKHPHLAYAQVSEHPSHTNPICLSGLGCTAGSGQDRNLGDFFQVDMDPTDGSTVVLWADTANQYGALAGSPLNTYARQVGGASLLKGKTVRPSPELTQRGNQVTDVAGDARPFGEGPNNPNLDLRQVRVADHGDTITITAKLAAGSLTGMIDPTQGPSASVVVSWWAGQQNADNKDLGQVHFVAMQTSGAAPVFYGGSPTYANGSSGTSRFAEFVPGPSAQPVTGSMDGGTITWTISKAAAGLGGAYAPTKLFSVTGTTLQGSPMYLYNAAEQQVDATPPFTFTAK